MVTLRDFHWHHHSPLQQPLPPVPDTTSQLKRAQPSMSQLKDTNSAPKKINSIKSQWRRSEDRYSGTLFSRLKDKVRRSSTQMTASRPGTVRLQNHSLVGLLLL